jgi:phosphoglycerol transferase MdoB-like AlkP superfamily enzyme
MSSYLKRLLLVFSIVGILFLSAPLILNIIKNNSIGPALILLTNLFLILLLALKTVYTELFNRVRKEESKIIRTYKL